MCVGVCMFKVHLLLMTLVWLSRAQLGLHSGTSSQTYDMSNQCNWYWILTWL